MSLWHVFFLPMFCRVFFLLLLFLLVKIVFSQTDYGPVFLCDARICSRVHIRGTRWCWRYRGDGAFFLSFFPTHTMIEDVASLKLRAEMRRKSTTFFFFYFILFFSLSLSNDTKAKYHLVASMPHPLDDRMLCPWTCFTFDVVQQAEQNSLSGETGFHCRNSWNQFT